ncbi:MAG: DUF2064 domain-containing protein [Eggerthellaceae bacterium]|nr:DUF2064 domain-containing protein [Eggerthellaceae bacterium]
MRYPLGKMKTRKNILLLFSKVPKPGLVKTRLTTLKDGIFSPEAASVLYHCMLFDVVETCMTAFSMLEDLQSSDGVEDSYQLMISTAPVEDLPQMRALFEDSGTWPREIIFTSDAGATFDEHYNDAFNKAWDAGADCILSMGADMPALTTHDVIGGFCALHELDDEDVPGIVLSPDQEMGVSIIGWNKETAFSHDGVFYNESGLTVLPAYIRKAKAAGLSVKYLPAVPDVDTMQDLMHAATLVEAISCCAPFGLGAKPYRTAKALDEMGFSDIRVMPNGLLDPRSHIDS